MSWIDYVVLILYFAVMVGIGIWAMRRVKNQEDYFMGGRGFGKLLQTFAAFGAGTGAHEPVTVGRTSWVSGLSGVWSALMWLFVTPVYWITAVWYRRMRHLTLGDWFVERYESKSMGAAYAVFAIVFYMTYLSTMFSAIAKFAVPLIGVETLFGMDLQYTLVPVIALIVVLYGVLGGLTAAYWTDLIQGIFIILLSFILIPYGLLSLVEKFGDPSTMGMMDGFKILHDQVSSDYFNLFSGPSAGEFPLQYIVSLTLLALVGIVVQPHFIATGGGSAKGEDEARIGLVTGNFLKRLCTIGWAITALIALALLAGNAEIAADPDRVWGVAAREILGPLNLGLVGLMLACLLAAMMSSADAYMLVTSALVSKNIFATYVNPHASEKVYLLVARITGLVIILGASFFALTMADVFGQFKLALELPILFAAPFWVGMYWRRSNRTAAWITIGFSFLFFLLLPKVIPLLPGVRSHPELTTMTLRVTTEFTRPATPADVAKRQTWETHRQGVEPPVAMLGEPIKITLVSGGKSIFWQDGVLPLEQAFWETVEQREAEGRSILIQRNTAPMIGMGDFRIDFLFYQLMGIDLKNASKATLETLRLPTRLVLPFLVLVIASFFTPGNSRRSLDRYYVKMRTEVLPDRLADQSNLEISYQNPDRFAERRLFPNSNFEFVKSRPKDYLGFLGAVAICIIMVSLLAFLAGIGA